MAQGVRPRRLGEAEKSLLRQLVEEHPLATLSELTDAFCRRTDLSVQHTTIRRRLEDMDIQRECAATLPARQDEPERRYGYQPAHRRQRPEQHYPNSLTDAEWRLVADLFEEEGQRGTPPRYPRRVMTSWFLHTSGE